jgi:hypothetical protein
MALEEVFPGQIQSFGSSPVIAVAGRQLPALDPASLAARFPESSLGPDLVYYLEQVLDPGEQAAGKKALEQVQSRENRDCHPWAFGAAMGAQLLEDTTSRERWVTASILVLALVLGLVLVARRVGTRVSFQAFSSGVVAILSWGASLYLFQLARGALYREIGLVGAVSLLGLALGAGGRSQDRTFPALLGTALGLVVAARLPPGLSGAALALACGGLGSFAAGQVMAELLRSNPQEPGALEAGDLLGAAAGSLLVSGVILTGPGPDVAAGILLLLGISRIFPDRG